MPPATVRQVAKVLRDYEENLVLFKSLVVEARLVVVLQVVIMALQDFLEEVQEASLLDHLQAEAEAVLALLMVVTETGVEDF